jgi:hypothetical protein
MTLVLELDSLVPDWAASLSIVTVIFPLISLMSTFIFREVIGCLVYVIGVAVVVLLEPFITLPCDNEASNQPTDMKFKNVLFGTFDERESIFH